MTTIPGLSKVYETYHQAKKIRRHVRKLRDEGTRRSIIVSGYPKSDNTWLTRMLADLAECEVVAYLSDYQDRLPRERGIVGREARRDIKTLKSHHSLPLLRLGGIPRSDVAIIVRDPRDVAVSGSGYFFGKENAPSPETIDQMIDMMLTTKNPSVRWIDQRWDQFVERSLDRGVPFVRYGDLVHKPRETLSPLLSHLDLDLSDEAIDRVVDYHAFDRAKQRYAQSGQSEITRHLRSGKPGDYRKYLSPRQKDRIESEFRPLMQKLGYL